jgi:four helix bundle protein
MKERSHEKLEVYRLAHSLALRVHRVSLKLPRFEAYEQASQVRRSSKSAAAQIVEGHALRQYKADYVRYIARAYASAEETIEHLRLVLETGSADGVRAECEELLQEYDVLSRKLFNYTQAVRGQHDPERVGLEERTWES